MKLHIEKKSSSINITHENGCVVARVFHLGDAERIVKRVNEYRINQLAIKGLEEANDDLVKQVDELSERNRELTETLKKLYDMYGTKPVEQYEHCVLENAKKLIEGVE